MNEKIKIVSHGTTAQVFIDGKDVAKDVFSYRIEQGVGGRCIVDIHYRYFPLEFTFIRENRANNE